MVITRRAALGAIAVSTAQGARAQARRAINVVDMGADRTGARSSVKAFQKAMQVVSTGGATVVRVPAGVYEFDIVGDADSILIPSGCQLECDRGVTFRWGFWGSPLFAIINATDVRLFLRGATIVWTGTYARTRGRRDAFGYGAAIPAYEWCCHIISMGSDDVTIDDVRCRGQTPENVQNAFIQVGGRADGSATYRNSVRNVEADDVCQVLLFACQRRFKFESFRVGRYSNASAGLYGPGHVVYATNGETPSEDGEISGIQDMGLALGPFSAGANTLSLKSVVNTKVWGVDSQRPEGVLNLQDCVDLEVNFRYRTASTEADPNVGIIYFIEPKRVNKRVKITGAIICDARREVVCVNMAGTSRADKNVECELTLQIVNDGTELRPAVAWVGTNGKARISYHGRSGAGAPTVLYVDRGSENNEFAVASTPGGAVPRVGLGQIGVQRSNKLTCVDGSRVAHDRRGFSDSNDNRAVCGT